MMDGRQSRSTYPRGRGHEKAGQSQHNLAVDGPAVGSLSVGAEPDHLAQRYVENPCTGP